MGSPLKSKIWYNDPSSTETILDYLCEIFVALLQEQEGFSGKRPLGESSWMYQIYGALVHGGWVDGAFDQDGYLDWVDQKTADNLIISEVEALFD